jgi:hypothetical protein
MQPLCGVAIVTLGSHQTAIGKSQNHITPKKFINRLGPFDLDPAGADPRPWDCATTTWTAHGLDREWFGLIWLNPPFDRYQVGKWVARLAAHDNGITLLHARTEAGWFEPIRQSASAILFLADRLRFCRPDGSEQSANSGAPPILASFGEEAATRLERSGIAGALVHRWQWRPSPLAPARMINGANHAHAAE